MGGLTMEMRAVTIDFDNYRERIDELKQCMIGLLPFKARKSGNGEGLHLLKRCPDEAEYLHAISIKQRYDDPKRVLIDAFRAKYGLTGNVLFNIKCIGKERKIAGE
jgi:hypothetical protein